MPLPVINYAALPPSGDPAAAGTMGAIAQGLQLGFMPHKMLQDSQQQKIANALAQVQLKYAPQMSEAELANRQAQTGLTNQQSQYYGPNIESEMALRGAQTGLTNEQAKYLPLDKLIAASNSSRQNSRFGDAYQLAKMLQEMPPAVRQQWIANNQEAFSGMVNDLGNKAGAQQQNQGNDMLGSAMSSMFPQFAPPKLPQGQGQISQLMANAPTGFTTSPEQNEQMRQAGIASANNALTTQATRRQAEGAQQVESVLNDPGFNQRAQDAFQYAGALKLGKKGLDAINQKNPASYNNYLTFTNNDLPLLASRIKTLDQMGATDSQREALEGLYKKTIFALSSNPERAQQLFNNLKDSISTVSRSVLQSAQPLGSTGRYGGNNSEQQKSAPALSDLEYTAKLRGISVDEVKRRMGSG